MTVFTIISLIDDKITFNVATKFNRAGQTMTVTQSSFKYRTLYWVQIEKDDK